MLQEERRPGAATDGTAVPGPPTRRGLGGVHQHRAGDQRVVGTGDVGEAHLGLDELADALLLAEPAQPAGQVGDVVRPALGGGPGPQPGPRTGRRGPEQVHPGADQVLGVLTGAAAEDEPAGSEVDVPAPVTDHLGQVQLGLEGQQSGVVAQVGQGQRHTATLPGRCRRTLPPEMSQR
ncbi:hypothetical protein GCM10023162_14800 [Klenkia terrae]